MKGNVNVTVIEEKILPIFINYFLCTYGYVIVGVLLIAINIPTSLIVFTYKALRNSYMVLAVVFLNNGFLGISTVVVGTKRLIDTRNGERFIDHRQCVLNAPLLLFTAEFMSGWSLLMNSLERLCVVTLPIYYYVNSRRINYSLIAGQYTIIFISVAIAVIASLIEPTRLISNFCKIQSAYSLEFYEALLLLTSVASMLSIVVMIIVLFILRKNFAEHFLSNNSHNRNLSKFLSNQKQYTQTAVISCCFTFFLVVVSSTVERIFEAGTSVTSQTIVMFCVYLRLLNSFNMVISFLYRQKDFQLTAIRCFKYLFGGRKQNVEPLTAVCFAK